MGTRLRPNAAGWILGVFFLSIAAMGAWALWYEIAEFGSSDDGVLIIASGIFMTLFFGIYGANALFTRMTVTDGSMIVVRPFRLPTVVDLKDIRSFNYIHYAPIGGHREICRMITLYTPKKDYRIRYSEKMMDGDWEMLTYLSDHFPRGAY